jgi:hypothetical protein
VAEEDEWGVWLPTTTTTTFTLTTIITTTQPLNRSEHVGAEKRDGRVHMKRGGRGILQHARPKEVALVLRDSVEPRVGPCDDDPPLVVRRHREDHV